MADEYFNLELRRLVALVSADAAIVRPRDVRDHVGRLRQNQAWSEAVRNEIDAIHLALERHITACELAKFGCGRAPADEDLDAIIERIRALAPLGPAPGSGEVHAGGRC